MCRVDPLEGQREREGGWKYVVEETTCRAGGELHSPRPRVYGPRVGPTSGVNGGPLSWGDDDPVGEMKMPTTAGLREGRESAEGCEGMGSWGLGVVV